MSGETRRRDPPVEVRAVIAAAGSEAHAAETVRSFEEACERAGVAGEAVVIGRRGEAPDSGSRIGATWFELEPERPRTPGACRNRGAEGAAAPWLCFADGDVVLEVGFLARALARLRGDAGLAGYGGRLDERHWRDGRVVGGARDLHGVGAGGAVALLGALWVCRRSAFEALGGFDPRLPSEEDFELGLRLRAAGWRLEAGAERAGYHDCAPRPSLAELGRRWRTGLFAGQGLALRHAWGTPAFAPLLGRQRLFVAALVGLAAGLVSFGAALAGEPLALALWAGLALGAWVAISLRKRSLRLGLFSLLTWTVQGVALLRALFFGPWGEMAAGGGASGAGRR